MNQILFMMHHSLELYEDLCQPVCKSCKISQTAFDIILFLANNPEYDTAKDICKFRGIKANLVSFHVEKLVQEGYLRREAMEGDRRQVKLLCTHKTKEIVQMGRSVQRQYAEILTEGITETEREVFQHCMDVIHTNIEKTKKERKEEKKK